MNSICLTAGGGICFIIQNGGMPVDSSAETACVNEISGYRRFKTC